MCKAQVIKLLEIKLRQIYDDIHVIDKELQSPRFSKIYSWNRIYL